MSSRGPRSSSSPSRAVTAFTELTNLCGAKTVSRTLQGAIFLILLAYYWWVWPSLSDFVTSIGGGDPLFKDFTHHYYPMARSMFHQPLPVPGFFYSAFFGLLLAPFGLLPINAAVWAWLVFQLVCFTLICALPGSALLRLSPGQTILYRALCATSLPVLHNFRWGQISVLITVCVLASFSAHCAGKRLLSGVLLGLATAIKFYPILFLPYFILKRDARMLAGFAAALIICYALLPAAILGPGHWIAFEHAALEAIAGADWISQDLNSQYVVHVGLRLSDLASRIGSVPVSSGMLRALGYGIVAVLFAAIWALQKKAGRQEASLSLTALWLTVPFLIRTSWPHYFAYLPSCQIALLASLLPMLRDHRFRGTSLGIPVLLSSFLSSSLAFNCFPQWGWYSMLGILFFADALLIIPLCVIAFGESRETHQSVPVALS
ncbi:MAG: hypothetical protein DMH00_04855 [Acidobacteria bacterium]|nr:MAG: hypothetical protein DMH00_04855 [Acidobacteriota bacterium]